MPQGVDHKTEETTMRISFERRGNGRYTHTSMAGSYAVKRAADGRWIAYEGAGCALDIAHMMTAIGAATSLAAAKSIVAAHIEARRMSSRIARAVP
jgi:hypothetical protein